MSPPAETLFTRFGGWLFPGSIKSSSMASFPAETSLGLCGGRPSAHPFVEQRFLEELLVFIKTPYNEGSSHTLPVAKFQRAIEADPELVDLFDQMFLQVSPENKTPDFASLLYMFDQIIYTPPKIYAVKDEKGNTMISAIPLLTTPFDFLTNTSAAYDLFRKPAFNAAFKDLLDAWGQYLTTKDSNCTLTDEDGGWFQKLCLEKLEENRGVFNETYVTPDPGAVNRGFASWDDFFTREFQAGTRPIHSPEDKSLIHSACESTVYRIAYHVKAHDQFWLKTQNYSLYDMLNRDVDYVKQVVGGTIYQAYLAPADYHRWRSPVDGTIEKTVIVPGVYLAVLPDDGAEPGNPYRKEGDPRGARIRSQAWLTQAATRALIYIRADNPDIGLMCFVAIGMADISTCAVGVAEGQKVKAGDLLGMFHFGGSSYTLIFGPQAAITFAQNVIVGQHIWVSSVIAQVKKA
ncbi:hypothetical protein GALMADRAFT_208526 [Galerina marginata CBS 339.88]|uniref:L-tryptophan decarboxylase PsiD-like domain-containing protein n=1 Tax=Galerina marginata (strain CBS 339.88) TaxID=685588 RepID=A0A067TDP6_GALM3|nr:hypothetical protein GALMADRAFT_208526 [Galerina marginata CBS 339.88]